MDGVQLRIPPALLGPGNFSCCVGAGSFRRRCRSDLAPHAHDFDHLVGTQIAPHRGIGQV